MRYYCHCGWSTGEMNDPDRLADFDSHNRSGEHAHMVKVNVTQGEPEAVLSDPADILALLREWGAKEAAVNPWANASFGGYLEVPEREGAYIIIPLDVLAADTGKEQ